MDLYWQTTYDLSYRMNLRRVVLALSGSDELKLWEVATGRQLRTFKGHSWHVNSVAFSPDGKLVLSGSEDNTLKLWEVATGRELRTFKGHFAWVSSVAFSPDGKLALSGSALSGFEDNTLKLWEVATGRELRTVYLSGNKVFGYLNNFFNWIKNYFRISLFKGHSDRVYSVAFSPDGKLGLSGSEDNTLKLWEIATGRELRTFKGHSASVYSVAFSPDGKLALSSSGDGSTRLWSIETGEEIAQMLGFENGEWATVTAQGYYVASPGGEKYINVRVGNQVSGVEAYPKFNSSDLVKVILQTGN